jgi:hypothetical protein
VPTSIDQLQPGCYDVDARIDDMDVNGIAASLNFGNSICFDGQTRHITPSAVNVASSSAEKPAVVNTWSLSSPTL